MEAGGTIGWAGHNWDPVDELASLRAEMRRLKAREDALREMFLMPGADTRFEGRDHVVEVVAQSRRVFDRRRLPAAILRDDRFYAVSVSKELRLKAKSARYDSDDEVVEPFH